MIIWSLMMNILLINPNCSTGIISGLADRKKWHYYDPIDLYEGLELARQMTFQTVFVRIDSCDKDRFSSLKKVKSLQKDVPIVAVLSVDCGLERARAWQSGASFCLTEPLNQHELELAASIALRQHARPNSSTIRIGDIELDIDRGSVHVAGKEINFSRKEFLVLEKLIVSKGKIVSRDQLLNHIYTYDEYPDAKIIDVFIFKIRSKLKAFANREGAITTYRGAGYKMAG
ncbi:response regulator transcription factor [Rhodobacteraceae bacterium]|nr:response regulator transcription factor [Paracoccaceae bacterium]